MTKIYFDYNATCPIRPEVIDFMAEAMRQTGNASSMHSFGRSSRRLVEEGRGRLADILSIRPNQVIFNSGATEGNNTILNKFRNQCVFISAIEHPSILQAAENISEDTHLIPTDEHGVIRLDTLKGMLNEHNPALISVMLVNNESGVIQPVKDITRIAKEHNPEIIVHSDITQAIGRLEIKFDDLGVDFASLSAHKFGGPQGVGALIMKRGLQVPKLLLGGGQERRQRAGTENVAGIAGLGLAAQICGENLVAYQEKLTHYKQQIENAISQTSSQIRIFGQEAERVANTVLFSLPGLKAETVLMNFDLEGIALSSGSACSSGTLQSSHVVQSMGANDEELIASIRLSMGWATTQEEVDQFITIWQKMSQRFQDKLS